MKTDTTIQRYRLTMVSLGFVLLAGFLGLRLLQKQVVEHPSYAAQAKSQQFEQQDLVGKRGQILLKDGVGTQTYPAATNQTTYALNVIPSQVADKRQVADVLSAKTGIAAETIFQQINNTKLYIPPLKRQLSFDEKKQIDELKLTGVFLTPEQQRFYPEDGVASQVLGFVNAEGNGQYGIEEYFNDTLRGHSGRASSAKNATGEQLALGTVDYSAPVDGDTVVLTIDRNIQYQAEQALDATVKKFSASGGSIIIMQPQTGAIMAMASRPTFDLNRFSTADPVSYTNQAISSSYEPGSTFKPIAMAAGLDAGVVTPNTTFTGTASVKVSDKEIFNSCRCPYGKETMTQVIERSDNVGMVFVQQQLGGQRLYDYIRRFGFGTATGIELAGEAVPPLAPVSDIDPVQFATMSFGQGISVTPIQLITAENVFATGGKLVQPHIVDQVQRTSGGVEQTQPKVVGQVVSPQTASQVSAMMVRVVEAGAGRPAAVPGYRVAGKTGTAQIATGGTYEKGTTIGNFVGFAPVEDPKFIMLVRIDRPKGVTFAEESAAPTFGELAKYLLQYLNVPRSN